MNSLFAHPVLKRVPLVRYSALTKRENRVKVQLLRDFPQYGQKGEIIEVLPGLMRNRLYPKNGAAYIIPEIGLEPRIPIVKKEVRVQPVIKKQPQLETITEVKKTKKESKKIEPVEIDGLLFNIPLQTQPSGAIKASTGGYSMITLNVTLGTLRFDSLPVTKSLVAQHITDVVSFNVPESDITLADKSKQKVEEITERGEYTLTITQEGSQSTVSKKIVVI